MTATRLPPISLALAAFAWASPALASPETAARDPRDRARTPTVVETVDGNIRALDPNLGPNLQIDQDASSRSVDVGGTVSGGDEGDIPGMAKSSSSEIDVHAVAPLSPRVELVSRIWGRSVKDDLDSITYGIASQGVRYRVGGGVWVETGAGLSRVTVDRDEELDVSVGAVTPAVMAAAGVDFATFDDVEVGLELRGAGGLYEAAMPTYGADLLLGARW